MLFEPCCTWKHEQTTGWAALAFSPGLPSLYIFTFYSFSSGEGRRMALRHALFAPAGGLGAAVLWPHVTGSNPTPPQWPRKPRGQPYMKSAYGPLKSTGVHFMVHSGFREYEVKKLRYPACSRQENAIIIFTEPGVHLLGQSCTTFLLTFRPLPD